MQLMNRRKFTLLIPLLIIILSSCTKEVPPINSGKRIVEIIPSGADSIGYVWFTYDNQNRLIEVKDSNDHSSEVEYTNLQYDNQGRVNKVVTKADYNSYITFTSNITLLYNNNNQVIEKILKSADTSTIGEVERFYYDAKDRMICDSVYGDLNATNANAFTSYTYDDNENLINKIWHLQYNGQWIANGETDYLAYDNKLNVYKDLKVLWYVVEDDMILSKNNVLSYTYNDAYSSNQQKTSFTYTYDNNSLITDVATVGLFTGSRHFVYN